MWLTDGRRAAARRCTAALSAGRPALHPVRGHHRTAQEPGRRSSMPWIACAPTWDLLVPDLVVVGGWGWRSGASAPAFARIVMSIGSAPCRMPILAAFYRAARFTVAPSYYRRMGLAGPGEHRPRRAVHRLVRWRPAGSGRRPCGFLRSRRIRKGSKKPMARWIVDDGALAKARERIAQELPAVRRTTWNDAAEVLLKHALG